MLLRHCCWCGSGLRPWKLKLCWPVDVSILGSVMLFRSTHIVLLNVSPWLTVGMRLSCIFVNMLTRSINVYTNIFGGLRTMTPVPLYECIGTHYHVTDYRLFATALVIPIRLQLKSCWFYTSNRVLNNNCLYYFLNDSQYTVSCDVS